MALAPSLARLAESLTGQFGTPLTLRLVPPPGEYDPDTGQSGGRPEDHETAGIVETYRSYEITGPVERGDVKVTLAADGLPRAPKTGDAVVIGGNSYRVQDAAPTYAQDRVVIYQLQVRR